jgi:serine protease inhibitor
MIILFTDKDIAKWMNSAPQAWKEWVVQETNENINHLMNADEIQQIGRLQGILHIMSMLNKLLEES